jgi:hypothetical protein
MITLYLNLRLRSGMQIFVKTDEVDSPPRPSSPWWLHQERRWLPTLFFASVVVRKSLSRMTTLHLVLVSVVVCKSSSRTTSAVCLVLCLRSPCGTQIFVENNDVRIQLYGYEG